MQAGCRIQQVADHLKPYGLTLENYASIREQQVGGFAQVGVGWSGVGAGEGVTVDGCCIMPAVGRSDLGVSHGWGLGLLGGVREGGWVRAGDGLERGGRLERGMGCSGDESERGMG